MSGSGPRAVVEAPTAGAAGEPETVGAVVEPPTAGAAGKPARGLGVWVIAFACTISYMGIGLVDPILPTISRALDATPAQAELLFSTYLFVTAIVMFFSAWVSSRIGQRRTLMLGLALVVAFALACALSASVGSVIAFRGGWGVGNALFVSTALAAIIGSTADSRRAIVLYEAAMGLGMAIGPLVGGALGELSWRGPFFGTAALMGGPLAGITLVLSRDEPAVSPRPLSAPFRALAHPRLRVFLVATLFYNFAYFTMLAYAPFPLDHASIVAGRAFTPLDLGLVFFGWGGLLALGSVLVAPRLTRRFGVRPTIVAIIGSTTVLLIVLAATTDHLGVQLVGTILGGGLVGIANTAMTEAAMGATDLPRDVTSSTYSGVRFIGGALGPTLAGPLSAAAGLGAPYAVGAAALVVTIALVALEHTRRPHETAVAEAAIIGRAD